MKKILTLCLAICCCFTLFACGKKTTTTTENKTYPYMDYFENNVRAIKESVPIGENVFVTNYGTMDDACSNKALAFSNNMYYAGLEFTAKAGTNVKSITFTVTAVEDVYVSGRISGYYEKDSKINRISAFGNYETTKLVKGTSKTYTIETYRDWGEMTALGNIIPGTEFVADFGIIKDSFTDDQRKITIMPNVYEIKDDGTRGSSIVRLDKQNISITNVSFVCEKIA